MSKAFIAAAIQNSAEITAVAANRAAADLIDAIVKELKKTGARCQALAPLL
jgi:DNA-binding protein HU-beta